MQPPPFKFTCAGSCSPVVDNNVIRFEPEDRPLSQGDRSAAFTGRVVEVGGVTQGVSVGGGQAAGQQGWVAVVDIVDLRAALPEIDAPVRVVAVKGAVVLNGDGVVELGTGNPLGNVGIADAALGQPFAPAIEAKVVAISHLVINRIPTKAIGKPTGVGAPTVAAEKAVQPRCQVTGRQGWAWIRGRCCIGIVEHEVEDRFAEIHRIAHPFGQLGRAAGGRVAL